MGTIVEELKKKTGAAGNNISEVISNMEMSGGGSTPSGGGTFKTVFVDVNVFAPNDDFSSEEAAFNYVESKLQNNKMVDVVALNRSKQYYYSHIAYDGDILVSYVFRPLFSQINEFISIDKNNLTGLFTVSYGYDD